MNNEARARKIIFEQLDVGSWNNIEQPSDLKREHSLQDDLAADSLDAVELIMRFDEEFGHEIEDTDAENIKTVGDIFDYVDSHFSR